MVHRTNQHDPLPKPDEVFLSEAQFAKLVELLTPGYELAKSYLAQAQKAAAPIAVVDPGTPSEDGE